MRIVIAAPRQGKSLFLDELATKLQREYPEMCVVRISFGTGSMCPYIASGKATNKSFANEIWGRVMFTLLQEFGCIDCSFEAFHSEPFFHIIDDRIVDVLSRKLGFRDRKHARPIVAADDFNVLCDDLQKANGYDCDLVNQAFVKLMCDIYTRDGMLIVSGLKQASFLRFAQSVGRPLAAASASSCMPEMDRTPGR